eukprot:CAMPEP_0196134254 /NCGR_PEP_ID=MMETSP0910-20130528/3200_1 /TAXON_ID=49265 /ORGANISM="Thalassiosira rotula, Strain GSO102" /LENGTH=209 /DNA_ID=CAMNT_0041394117 /DNA_START=187 /DNA_END=816 /DNA_ORIENTATION=+
MDLIVDFPQRRSPPRTRPQTRAGVSFAHQSSIKYVENLSSEHKADLWLTARELNASRNQLSLDLKAILSTYTSVAEYAQETTKLGGDTSAFMGLENYMMKSTPMNIKDRRHSIWRTVFIEQERQKSMNVCDPEAISRIAGQVSKKSQERARIVGLLHAENRKAAAAVTPFALDDDPNDRIRCRQSARRRSIKEFPTLLEEEIFFRPQTC